MFGNKNNNIFEQYKIAIDSVEKNSDRRLKINQFFISINSVLLGIIFIKDINIKLWLIIGFFGILLSFIWYFNVESYRILNSVKFKIIYKMEKTFFPFYKEERELLKELKYKKLSKIEQYIPFLFLILYLILFIYSILTSYILPYLCK